MFQALRREKVYFGTIVLILFFFVFFTFYFRTIIDLQPHYILRMRVK